MAELTADLFISADGYALGENSGPYFGYGGPDLDRWIGFMDERYVLDRVRQAAAAMQPKRGATVRSNTAEAAPQDGPPRAGSPRQGQTGRAFDRSDPVHRVEREALKLAVQWPGLTGPEFDALGAEAFSVPVHVAVFGLVAGCSKLMQFRRGQGARS